MKKRCILTLLILAFSPAVVFAQAEDGQSDRKAILKLCRNLLKVAVAQMDSGNYDVALAHLDSVFQCDAKNPDAFYYKALILGWRGDSASVMEILADGVKKAPLSTRLKLLYTRHLINNGSLDEAAGQIDMILGIKPEEGEALYLKGLILQEQADTTEALKMYEKALGASLGK
jgi:Flp pilus assembly protein TadD